MDKTALTIALSAAVPLWMRQLLDLPASLRGEKALAWAHEAGGAVAYGGDILQYRGAKKGDTAKVFNHAARGLAALAISPGGVLFAGVHWCVEHPMGIDCASFTGLTCSASGYDEPGTPAVVNVRPVGGVL